MIKIKEDDIGNDYIKALRSKYQSQIDECLANLRLYSTNMTGIGEHSDLLTEFDVWVSKYSDSKGKLDSLNEIFINSINGGKEIWDK